MGGPASSESVSCDLFFKSCSDPCFLDDPMNLGSGQLLAVRREKEIAVLAQFIFRDPLIDHF